MAEENIWQSILKESAPNRMKVGDSTVIFAGMFSSGKSTLLDTFCPKLEDDEPLDDDEEQVDYRHIKPMGFSYFNVSTDLDETPSESTSLPVFIDDAEAMARVNIWQIDNNITKNNLDMIMNIAKTSASPEKFLFAITIDINDPPVDCVKNLRAWLKRLESDAAALNLASDTQQYIRAARSTKGDIHAGADAIELSAVYPFQHLFKVPLIVIATKSDTIRTDDAVAAKSAKDLQGRLRAICLEVGAALIYTSAGDKENMINCNIVQKYILHRLYPNLIPFKLSLQDGISNAFIPSGYDTPDLISISTSIKITDYLNSFNQREEAKYLESIFKGDGPVPLQTPASADPATTVETEAEWLHALQTYLHQVTGETMVSESTDVTPSRRMLSRPPVAHLDEEEVRAFFKSLLIQPSTGPGAVGAGGGFMSPGGKKTDTWGTSRTPAGTLRGGRTETVNSRATSALGVAGAIAGYGSPAATLRTSN